MLVVCAEGLSWDRIHRPGSVSAHQVPQGAPSLSLLDSSPLSASLRPLLVARTRLQLFSRERLHIGIIINSLLYVSLCRDCKSHARHKYSHYMFHMKLKFYFSWFLDSRRHFFNLQRKESAKFWVAIHHRHDHVTGVTTTSLSQ